MVSFRDLRRSMRLASVYSVHMTSAQVNTKAKKNIPQRMEVDVRILEMIDTLREEHHACTMRAVASRLQLSTSWVTQRMCVLRDDGLIDWTVMPGSVHRVSSK